MTTIAMKAPAGTVGIVQSRNGTVYTIDANGFIAANSIDAPDLIAAGFGMVGEGEFSGAQPMANTNLTTVGAGTLLAAAIASGLITRTGPTAAYTDTVDIATAIIAAQPAAGIGDSWLLIIKNSVAFPQTIATAAGVTLSGQIIIPPNSVGHFLVSYTAAGAVAIRGLGAHPMANIPDVIYTTGALQSAVLTAALMAGARIVHYENTGVTPANLQFDTAANIVAAIPNAVVGQAYELNVRNSSSGANTATMTTNTGLTLHGTMTIAQNVTRRFVVILTSLTAVDIWSMGIGAAAV